MTALPLSVYTNYEMRPIKDCGSPSGCGGRVVCKNLGRVAPGWDVMPHWGIYDKQCSTYRLTEPQGLPVAEGCPWHVDNRSRPVDVPGGPLRIVIRHC